MECTNIDDLIREGKEWKESLVKRGAYRTVKLEKLVSIANIQAFKNILDQLLKDLENDNFNIIKVHGEIGTGKSVLVQHLNNCLANSIKIFDIVIFLPASRYRDENKYSSIEVGIQHIVAERLGLDIQGIEDVNFVAQKLHDAKYLLLLDDVMETIELEAIGIPMITKGSKIVYATSKIESKIVSTFDQSLSSIKVERFGVGDAWQLFQNILTTKNDANVKGDIQRIARKIVNWCDGYFSLISLVAPLFKSKTSVKSWNKSLDDLRKPAKRGDIYMKAFENVWHLSYDDLEENQKICFLFSLLYPEEYKIPKCCLFDCWEANDLLGNDVIGEEMMDCLIEAALLYDNSDKQYVTIHKLCRGAALNILQKSDKFNCLVVEKELENVQDYSWEARQWISLADSGIQVLPENVTCPKLTTLFLQKNSNLKKISRTFFDEMKELIVLDLYKAGFEFELSMANLKKLRVLYVNDCAKLKKFPLVIEGHDNMLEVLDLRDYIINEIPNDIKRLEHLRRLIVSIKEGDTLNRLIISEISSLKELIINVKSDVRKDVNYVAWCNEVTEHIIEKIETFNKLTTLQFCFKYDTIEVIQVSGDTLKIFVPKQRSLQHIWNSINLHYNALQVYIGFRITPNLEIPDCFCMYDNFVLSCEKIVNDPAIEDVLLKVKSLIMMNDDSLEHLNQIFVPHIHHCLIHECNIIEAFMHTSCFSNLEI
ncbi:disease resistance protein At4g27190-like [Bidens hawaiensis]|uniref:disease resistance protein At4g27190-like n=1 Tax=Bidens hawaiensis TaxID=980011 RepID=UPI0040498257